MKIKVTIKEDSEAAKVFKENMARREAFKKAVQENRVDEYVRENPNEFARPLSPVVPK